MNKYFLVGLYVAIAIACCAVSVYADQDYLSFPRVGNEIDSTELSYFGLFQLVDSVRSVQVRRVSADSVDMVVHFKDKADQSVRFGNYFVEHLEGFLTNYETLTTEYLELHANALLKYVRVHTFPRRGPVMNFELTDNSIVKGELLYVNDSCCILMKSKNVWNYKMEDSNFIFLRYDQIEKLLDVHYPYLPIAIVTAVAVVSAWPTFSSDFPSNVSSQVRTSAYVTAGITLAGMLSYMAFKQYYGPIRASRDEFRREVGTASESTYFSDYPSPEIIAALRRHQFPSTIRPESPPPTTRGYSRFNISIGSPTLFVGANFNTSMSWVGYENESVTGGSVASKSYISTADLDFSYRLSYRWGITAGLSTYTTGLADSTLQKLIDISTTKFRAGVEFVATPATAPTIQSAEAHLRVEPTLLLVNRPAYDFRHRFIYEGIDTVLHQAEYSTAALGLRLAQSVEFFPSSHISFGIQLEELLGPTISMPNPSMKTKRYGRRNEIEFHNTEFEVLSFIAAIRLGIHL